MVWTLETCCDNVEGNYEGHQLVVGAIEESFMLESMNSMTKVLLDRATKLVNKTCFEVIDIKEYLFKETIDQNLFIPEVDLLVVGTDVSTYGYLKYYVNSAWLAYTYTIIVSKVPDKYEASLDSLQCQTTVKYLMFGTVFFVAFLLTLISLVYKNSKTEVAQKSRSFWQLYFHQLWNITCSVMSQGVSRIPRNLPGRIVWAYSLICFLIARTFLTSFLQSKLSVIEYDTIDTISDLLDETKTRPLPVMFKNGNTHTVLIKKALSDPLFKQLLSKMEENADSLALPAELLRDDDFLKDVNDGKKALIASRLLYIVGYDFFQHVENSAYQYGHAAINSGILTSLFNRSFPRNHQEKINILLLNFVEGNVLQGFTMKNEYLIDKATWYPDSEEGFDPMSIKDIYIYFSMALISLSLHLVVLLAEIMIYAIKVE